MDIIGFNSMFETNITKKTKKTVHVENVEVVKKNKQHTKYFCAVFELTHA